MTRERCDNDLFYIHNDLRVAVKDPAQFVVVTDPLDAPQDGREVILLTPRMECVTENVVSGIRSYDITNTSSSSHRLLSQLEHNQNHIDCFDLAVTQQTDGSWLIQGTGMSTDMFSPYGYAMYILDALTFTDVTGTTGRTEIISRRMPDGSSLSQTPYMQEADPQGYHTYSRALYYEQEEGAYLSVKFTLDTVPTTQPVLVRLTTIDGVYGDHASVLAEHHVVEYEPWNNRTAKYYHAPLFIAEKPDKPYFFTIEVLHPETGERLYRVTYRPVAHSTPKVTPSPTPVPAVPTATPAPTPTPAATPRPTIAPASIVFENDSVVVNLERCENDLFYIYYDLRVTAKNPARNVLVTADDKPVTDGREAILVQPRVEAVDGTMYGTISRFNVGSTGSSARTLSTLETSLYHLDCFDQTITRDSDGSLLIRCVGNAQVMTSSFISDYNYILTALTLTDATGQTGTTEILYRSMPSAHLSGKGATYRLIGQSGGYGAGASTQLYRLDGYAYLSAQFTFIGDVPMNTQVHLLDVNGESGILGSSYVTQYIESTVQGETVNTYYHVLYRIDDPGADVDAFTLEAVVPGLEEPLFTASYRDQTITVTPSPTPAPTPAANPAASGLRTSPPHELATWYTMFQPSAKPLKYSDYACRYWQYGDFSFFEVYFRYHDPLPETAVMRIVAIDKAQGNFGEAPVKPISGLTLSAPSDLIGADIFAPDLKPGARSVKVACVDTATGETLFETTFTPVEGASHKRNDTYVEPTPAPVATPTPAPTPRPTMPPDTVGYSYINLTLYGRDEGYVHDKATFRAYGRYNALAVSFRYNGELPVGAFLRIVNRNGTSANFGEGPLTVGADGLITGYAVTDPLNLTDLYDLRFACIDPATDKAVFECSLQGREHKPQRTSRPYPYPTPRPTDPPLPTVYTVEGVTPTPAPVTAFPGDDAPYGKLPLEPKAKPQKYAHYAAHLRVYQNCVAAVAYFRWHDPLPEGAYVKVTSINDKPGVHGTGTITPADFDDAPEGLLCASVVLQNLPEELKRLTLACIDPATGETLFTVTLVSKSGLRVPAVTAYPNGVYPGTDTDFSLLDGVIGDPAPTPWSPTYNYNNNNYGWNYGGTSWIEDGMQITTPNPYGGGWGW